MFSVQGWALRDVGQWVTPDELFAGAYSSCIIIASRVHVRYHAQWRWSTEIKLWLRRFLLAHDGGMTAVCHNSNVTVKVSAAKKTIARRSDSEATALVVAFGPALWQSRLQICPPASGAALMHTARLMRGV